MLKTLLSTTLVAILRIFQMPHKQIGVLHDLEPVLGRFTQDMILAPLQYVEI